MAKARIYELAKKIGRSNKELTDALEALGVKGKTHSSSIDDETANRVMEYFLGLGEDELFSGPLDTELGDFDETEDEEIETEKEAEESPVAVAMVKSKGEVLAEAPDEAKEPVAPVKEKEREQKKPIIAIPESAIKIEKALRQVKPQEPEVEIPAPEEPAEAAVTTAVPLKPVKKEKKKEKARQPQQPQQPAPPQRRPGKRGMETRLADLVQDDLDDLTGADRFKNAAVEPVDKAKPDLQRAFQAIRKLDQGRPAGGPPRGVTAPRGKRRGAPTAGGRPGPQSYQQRSAPKPVHPSGTALRKKAYKFTEGMTVKEFAELIAVKSSEIIKQFMGMGYAPNINQPVDMDAAMLIAENLGIKLEVSEPEEVFDVEAVQDAPESLLTRSPIVTIMGHVDHGKTSLLDAIRETKVTEGEAGGITQHIGAYKVQLKGREITFLDTPGHEAFTALRARGASVTDIVVLIVAADDGVKPQTVEAIDHAKAAGVPIMVAINKIDKPESDPTRVRQELSEHGIISEEWGGQNIFAEISAKKRIGIESLLELVLLQADMLELKANPDRMAAGVIIESRLDKGRGPVATVLVQHGTLKIGDSFLAGMNTGKVKALYDDMGKKIKAATPSTPVEVIGFSEVPNAGEAFVVMEDEKKARAIATARFGRQKTAAQVGKRKLTLDELYSKIAAGEVKDLNIVIKGDVQGSVEAIRESMEQIKHAEVQVRVIHSAVGGINESDVMLASASDAIIIGFNVRPELKAASLAEQEGVDIELYNVIYEAIDDVKKALEGMLKPTIKEKILGHAEVREIFVASRIGTIAGCMVVDGVMQRNCDGVRVIRNSIVVYTGRLGSLKRFKEDAKEVATGYECGIMIENFNDVKVGDIFEDYVNEEIAGKL